ncbi:MAG TPA: hypothetical protein VNI02_18290 [Blastocatellia bacterium]|jgi:hypothetical protein|nr:hypothetical protein [Blastocatellia bacterium]
MPFHFERRSSLVMLAATLTLLSLCPVACRSKSPPADVDPGVAGEPENYSATVVRSIDDGTEREASVTRVARSGELRREEWTEQAGRRALIWRPDRAKAFLLDLDKRMYVELPLSFAVGRGLETDAPRAEAGQAMASDDTNITRASDEARRAVDPEAVERAVGDAPSPERVETRWLADQTIENHVCRVSEQRAIFSGGHAEITRTFRAVDLGGLAIRIETVAEPRDGGAKVIISRRDIRTDVSPDEFVVPAEFRKVDKLPLR